MLYAIDNDGKRVGPSPKASGSCPACGGAMVSKCGEKVVWHWSHKTGSNDCDEWYEPISGWHQEWLSHFPESCRESVVVSQEGNRRHVVDVCTEDGTKVDFQSQRITVKEMCKRDSFWGGAFWILDARTFFGGLKLRERKSGPYYAFEIVEGWHYPKAAIMKMRQRILSLDKGLSLAVNYRSQEEKWESELVFELWSQDEEVFSRVLEGIRRVNAENAMLCGNRRAPWVFDCRGESGLPGLWLENGKGVAIGQEYRDLTVFVDCVEGAEGKLFNLRDSELISKRAVVEVFGRGFGGDGYAYMDEKGNEWTLLSNESVYVPNGDGENEKAKEGAVSGNVQMSIDFGFEDEMENKEKRDWSGLRLKVELVPSTSWYSNVRSEVSKEEWDRIRKKCYSLANHKCEICGDNGHNQGFRWPVECHEIWDYDPDSRRQTLKGFISLCPYCHKCKHIGLAQINGEYDLALSHLMRVNSIGREEADSHVQDSFEEWERRSEHEWEVDITYMDSYMGIAGEERKTGQK